MDEATASIDMATVSVCLTGAACGALGGTIREFEKVADNKRQQRQRRWSVLREMVQMGSR